ncbi:MAG: NAD(P)H-dependent flavin oxidoreductase [Leadbetterella sp.]
METSNLKLPIIAAPMFLISDPDLVYACCTNGVIGTFPALNARTSLELENWIVDIQARLDIYKTNTGLTPMPFGINLIVHSSNSRLQEDVTILKKYKVPLVITSLGAVQTVVDMVHSYGGLIYHDVIKTRHAQKASEAGVDGLILVCNGAGGHGGTLHPFAFVSEVKAIFSKTIILAGCISNGHDIAAALSLGVDYVYMGTRFIATQEAKANQEYKNMILESKSDDIEYTDKVSGVNANFMKKSLEQNTFKEHQMGDKIDLEKELNPDSKAWKTIWSAGQGVAAIDTIPSISQLVETLQSEFVESAKKIHKHQ